MSELTRRGFIQSVASGLPVLAAAPAVAAAETAPQATQLDRATLLSIAEVVLPSELGGEGMRSACDAFERWLEAYEPVAEVNHGYGTAEIDYLPAHPGPGWAAQLDALNLEAKKRTGRSFAELDAATRRETVRRQIGSERSLPAAYEARHVAIGLLAWWCATPAATDHAYRARIGKETCRSLALAPEQPAPVDAGR